MGFYVNPENESKEEFLSNKMEFDSVSWDMLARMEPASLPVVLVDNGPFSAAGVAYNEQELSDFQDPNDPRPKRYFLVPIEELIPVTVGLSKIIKS